MCNLRRIKSGFVEYDLLEQALAECQISKGWIVRQDLSAGEAYNVLWTNVPLAFLVDTGTCKFGVDYEGNVLFSERGAGIGVGASRAADVGRAQVELAEVYDQLLWRAGGATDIVVTQIENGVEIDAEILPKLNLENKYIQSALQRALSGPAEVEHMKESV